MSYNKRNRYSNKNDLNSDFNQYSSNKNSNRPDSSQNGNPSQDRYEPPPMEATPSYYIDNSGDLPNNQLSYSAKPQGLHPASYGIVNPELQTYLRRCEENLDDKNISELELEIFLDRMQEEIKDRELQLMTDHNCSVVLEKMLSISKPSYIIYFLSLTRGQEVPLMIHRFASHVLQSVFACVGKFINSELSGSAEKVTIELQDSDIHNDNSFKSSFDFQTLIIDFVNSFKSNLGFLILDPFGSHIVRSVLYLLSGKGYLNSNSVQSNMRSKKSANFSAKKNKPVFTDTKIPKKDLLVPDSFKDCLVELLGQFDRPDDPDFLLNCAYDKVGNPALQIIIELLADLKMSEIPGAILDQILLGLVSQGTSFESSNELSSTAGKLDIKIRQSNNIASLISDPIGSRLLETIISASSPELLQKIYISSLRGNLYKLSLDPCANYVIQTYLKKLNSGPQLLLVLDEILPKIDDLIKKNRSAILSALISACASCNEGYAPCFQKVLKAFSGNTKESNKQLVVNLAYNHLYSPSMPPQNGNTVDPKNSDYQISNAKISPQGTVLIQNLLTFPYDSIKELVKSFSYLDAKQDLILWSKDASGSRIIESFLKSSFDSVPIKHKRKMLVKLTSFYSELALDRFGSHIVDCCWNVADLKFKQTIAEELSKDSNVVKNSFFGKFVWKNCNIDLFMSKNDSWKSIQKSSDKKKDLFKDILGLESVSSNNDLSLLNDTSDDEPIQGKQNDDPLHKLGFSTTTKTSKKSKRNSDYQKDEIDDLFKKSKKSKSQTVVPKGNNISPPENVVIPTSKKTDKSLDSVIDAIKNTKKSKKKSSKSKKSASKDEPTESGTAEKKIKSKKEKLQESKDKRKFF
ncbi:Nucleolar protein 9 [Smittium mucronatum]|uniref:Nucleolar protein 9 n=1 Tax=Smittium mucronatum TaxID=133383 RepID=A0A1R0GSB6_9FUNG|nr:Nucleolar protein 9 [Smittium mucronatum]